MENKTPEELRLTIVDEQIIDLVKRLDLGGIDRETHYLVGESINAFSELLELWQFALEKGWSAEKLIQLTNIISALRN